LSDIIKIASLQTATLSFDKAKIDYFLTIAKTKKCSIFVIPEYVANLFFKELEGASKKLIKEQTAHQKDILKELSKKYYITIVAPLVVVDDNKIKKVMYKFSKGESQGYEQQILIGYEHWRMPYGPYDLGERAIETARFVLQEQVGCAGVRYAQDLKETARIHSTTNPIDCG